MTFCTLRGKFIDLWKNYIGRLVTLPLCSSGPSESRSLRADLWGPLARWRPFPQPRTTFSDSDFIHPWLEVRPTGDPLFRHDSLGFGSTNYFSAPSRPCRGRWGDRRGVLGELPFLGVSLFLPHLCKHISSLKYLEGLPLFHFLLRLEFRVSKRKMDRSGTNTSN